MSDEKKQKIPEKIVQEYLTKSAFLKGLECPRKLKYYNDERYIIDNPPYKEYTRIMGLLVGHLAKFYHPCGVDLTNVDQDTAIKQTQELLLQDEVIIYEAAFVNEKYLIRADICVKKGNNIEIIEVKSKSFNPEEDTFFTKRHTVRSTRQKNLLDVTFQTIIAKRAYPQLNFKSYLMYIDKSQSMNIKNVYHSFKLQKNTNNELKIEQVGSKELLHEIATHTLIKLPVYEFVDEILKDPNIVPLVKRYGKNIEELIEDFKVFSTTKNYYKVVIGKKCKKCEYRIKELTNNSNTVRLNGYQECWSEALNWQKKDFLAPHIFDIWYLSINPLLNKEIYLMKDIDIDKTFKKKDKHGNIEYLSNKAERQILQIQKTLDPSLPAEHIFPNLKKFIEKINYPLYLIDFETAELSIPNHINRRPYDLVAFQFSVHKMYKNSKVEHHADWVMTSPGKLPNYDFVRALKGAIDSEKGSILHYHKHERIVLNEILHQLQEEKEEQEDADELLDWLKRILNTPSGAKELSMVDMFEFVIKGYYHRAMKGSNSIKSVLPAILSSSEFLKQKYSSKYYSQNYPEGIIWYQEEDHNTVRNPYDILLDKPKKKSGLADLLEINVGSSAAKAYAYLQFSGISREDRENIEKELLRYCELDTLAMVMILEHWLSII